MFESPGAKRHYGLLLALVCAVTLFPFLGETLFNTRGEPREALVALSMVEDGNWILPVNSGVDTAYKPPLFHWLIAAFSTLAGGVSEFTSRLPSALALALMVVCGYLFYARRRGVELALLAALLTLGAFEVHRAGAACRVDMVLTLMMVGALYQLYKWSERAYKGVPWLAVLCLSGAILTKGPVGGALPCLVMVVFAWLRGGAFWRSFGRMFLVGLAACVLPLCWYVAAWLQGGDRFFDLVYEENVLRLLGRMTYDSHVNPRYYNVVTVVSGFLPWTLLVLFSLFVLPYRRPASRPSLWWARLKNHVRSVDPVRLFTFLSLAVIFVFYCIPKSKRSVYLLPVYPFIAYYLAEFFLWIRDRHRSVVSLFGYVVSALALLLPIVFAVLRLDLIPESLFAGGKSGSTLAMVRALSDAELDFFDYIAIFTSLAGVWYFLRAQRKNRATGNVFSVAGLVLCLYFSLDVVYQPIVLNAKSDRPQAEFIRKLVPKGAVYAYRSYEVPGNPMRPFTINFYLGDRVLPFNHFKPAGSGYVITGEGDIDAFRAAYPDYEAVLHTDFRHKSCDDRRMLYLYQFQKRAN